MYSINESILNSFKEAFLLEDYKSAKVKLVEKGASENEADSLISRHKELKKLNRLDKSLIDIDVLIKTLSPEEIKQKLFNISTQTKSEIKKRVEGKIVGENDEYWVYKIDTPEDAYRFHGLTKWCICSGDRKIAKEHFDQYSNNFKNVFYFFVRKQITDPENVWNYIALQRKRRGETYWDMNDNSHVLSDIPVKLPEFDKPSIEKLSFSERIEKAGFKKNSNGEYDVDGNVKLKDLSDLISDLITNGKFNIKFNKVSGDFDCSECETLTSLEGCPKKVGGGFHCSYCRNLTSLEGCPKEIGGYFSCNECDSLTSLEGAPTKVNGYFECHDCQKLTSLKGSPREVGGNFSCSGCNNLTSLEGAPEKVGGLFSCTCCANLKSLEGVPKEVGGIFNCTFCDNLTSLEGVPEKINGNFSCFRCKNLTSLEGAPKEVGGDFHCGGDNLTSLEGAPKTVGGNFGCSGCNNLKSLEGAPEKVGGYFDCSNCGAKFTEDDVREHCEVSGTIKV